MLSALDAPIEHPGVCDRLSSMSRSTLNQSPCPRTLLKPRPSWPTQRSPCFSSAVSPGTVRPAAQRARPGLESGASCVRGLRGFQLVLDGHDRHVAGHHLEQSRVAVERLQQRVGSDRAQVPLVYAARTNADLLFRSSSSPSLSPSSSSTSSWSTVSSCSTPSSCSTSSSSSSEDGSSSSGSGSDGDDSSEDGDDEARTRRRGGDPRRRHSRRRGRSWSRRGARRRGGSVLCRYCGRKGYGVMKMVRSCCRGTRSSLSSSGGGSGASSGSDCLPEAPLEAPSCSGPALQQAPAPCPSPRYNWSPCSSDSSSSTLSDGTVSSGDDADVEDVPRQLARAHLPLVHHAGHVAVS